MNVHINEVKRLILDAAKTVTSESEAEYFADLYVETHLHRSPRLNPIEEAVADIKSWTEGDADRPAAGGYTVDVEREGVMVLDFHGFAPGIKLKSVHGELETRCKKNGIAAIGLRNSAGIITLLPWVSGLARRNLIGLAMFNGGVNCSVPFGGTSGFFGTLPLAYAIPTADEPVIADMATTEIPFFQIKNAKQASEPLPGGTAVDRNGLPTTVAAEALSDDGIANLLPIGGGFKGYSLVMLIEILTGSLVRSLLSNAQTAGWHPTEYGALIIAIDIGSFTDIESFKREVSEMCGAIRKQQPAEGVSEIAIPGDRGRGKAAALRKAGEIDVPNELMEELTRLARK